MKRLIFLISMTFLYIGSLMAQDANRSGFVVELQGGAAFGKTVLDYECTGYYDNCGPRLRGGMVGSVDFGYRFATSTHIAIGGKLGIWGNLADFKYTYALRIMPGLRWTSNDFHNMSVYAELDAGVGTSPSIRNLHVPIEISAGVNLTRNLYAGAFVNFSMTLLEERFEDVYSFKYTDSDGQIFKGSLDIRPAVFYPSAGIRVGYRF